jgi:hypothetical protein
MMMMRIKISNGRLPKMNTSNKIFKWVAIGALLGYFILHPLIHIISILHFFSGSLVPKNLASEIMKSFSFSMLPWGIAFMILNALIGLFWGKIKQADKEKSEIIVQLQIALEKVKILSGFLPICASCKRIRDDKGYWNQIEVYISEHSEAEFSHGICPECSAKLYPEIYKST